MNDQIFIQLDQVQEQIFELKKRLIQLNLENEIVNFLNLHAKPGSILRFVDLFSKFSDKIKQIQSSLFKVVVMNKDQSTKLILHQSFHEDFIQFLKNLLELAYTELGSNEIADCSKSCGYNLKHINIIEEINSLLKTISAQIPKLKSDCKIEKIENIDQLIHLFNAVLEKFNLIQYVINQD